MRIERVTAHAFGPLHDETLEFAPGMTLVYGRNEAGKSSWHAALYAGLCGVRRAKGQPLAEDREFREQHKPWDGERWETEVLLRLEDGRRIELRQDLAGRVACRATDIGLGLDVSAEVMYEGSPDGSRWLGLDRRAFLATACVDQAELLAVAQDPNRLQEHMQRAAATRGTDATAVEAIQRLEHVRREQVGADTANSVKPLRRARREIEAAERALGDARERHDAFLALSASAEAARGRAEAAEAEARRLAAGVADSRAVAARARADRAAALLTRHPDGPPAGLVSGDHVSQRVAAALDAWERRPSPVVLSGHSADVLQEELARLPAEPTGDLAPAQVVVRAKAEFDRRQEALRLLDPPPVQPTVPMTAGLDAAALLDLAARLEATESTESTGAERRATGPAGRLLPRTARAGGVGRREQALWVGAGTAAMSGSLVLAGVLGGALAGTIGSAGWAVVGLLFLVAGLGLARSAAHDRARRLPGTSEADWAATGGDRADRETDRETARAFAAQAGLPTTSAGLRELAEAHRGADASEVRLVTWIQLEADRRAAKQAAESTLVELLAARDVDPALGPETGYELYLANCQSRSELARQASRAAGLGPAIETRRRLEHNAAEVRRRIETTETELWQVAHLANVGEVPAELAGVVAALHAWQSERTSAVALAETALGDWGELETLLGGRTLAALQADAERLAHRAADLGEDLGDSSIALDQIGATADLVAQGTGVRQPTFENGDPERHLADLERRASTARADAERTTGQLTEMALGLPSVVEAEERRAAATAELERVELLDRVLETTLTLLRQAEQRVHRDLAPILNASIAARLPRISAGRYLEAAVNPADLAVRVKAADGGQWRDARRLSHGTREQIHLLLRVAMTEQLVTPGEIAPLLLDEVTVQSDQRRATELLDLLHDLSRERQVILFTHDERALAWARQAFAGPADRLVELGAAGGAV